MAKGESTDTVCSVGTPSEQRCKVAAQEKAVLVTRAVFQGTSPEGRTWTERVASNQDGAISPVGKSEGTAGRGRAKASHIQRAKVQSCI